jgi:hypothetical protein
MKLEVGLLNVDYCGLLFLCVKDPADGWGEPATAIAFLIWPYSKIYVSNKRECKYTQNTSANH